MARPSVWRRFNILFITLMCMLGCLAFWKIGSTGPRHAASDLKVPQEYSDDLPACSAIIHGDIEGKKEEFDQLLASKRRRALSNEFYLNATEDCEMYIDNRGFVMAPLSAEERDFPIAYSMVIHDKIEMFERLLRAIYNPQNVYCVHVDRKSPEDFLRAVKGIVSCLPNVFLASRLESVVYASWSRVQADLNCMQDLLKSPVQWRYLLNTCGTDFPIKTNAETVRALKQLNGKNSMESEAAGAGKTGRWRYHFNVTDTVRRTGVEKGPPPIGSPMFTGNAYFVVTRDFVNHVLEDRTTREFMEWGKDTYSPDEHLWATLQRMNAVPGSKPANGKFDASDMNAIARLVKWSYSEGDVNRGAPYPPCAGQHRRAVCVYGAGDLQWVFQQHHLLANKFDPEVDDVAIRCVEAYLRFRAMSGRSPSADNYRM
ncbi:beta-1,3-galactosyl-O-glycosyl-glycoprotein beta-1,6-N-acetylglucosaminyltransferase 3 [Lampris incognitus]|uniref:beta-1,3-galactosyl-O-glycosyl-glycoprotein beta-1,6-N-acetylglucosaminyltransferase 3 n=1 Tax=Lampris incognitus TaxID=2546036 RepID=UPI0024B4DA26|nr:beta-1,3-galactosyl-O-glycosyl-glycoprotein beta-1,6-N-acetylglucosaminyltransferase 3 [Lampris incognitus]